MKAKYICYFYDNKIKFVTKNKIISHEFNVDTVMYGKIVNIEKFIKSLKKFIKKYHINMLFSPKILVITPHNFYEVDEEIMSMAFNAIGTNKVILKKETEYIPKKNNSIILNICETYLTKTIYEKNKYKSYIYQFNLFKDKESLMNIVIDNKNIESCILLGVNKKILSFIPIIKERVKVHYYNNYETYIVDEAMASNSKK